MRLVAYQLLLINDDGDMISNQNLNTWYKNLCLEAAVKRISSHGARHTSGSSYVVLGAGQNMIGKLLGHSDTHATERYTHIQTDATASIVELRWAALRSSQNLSAVVIVVSPLSGNNDNQVPAFSLSEGTSLLQRSDQHNNIKFALCAC
jgi:hypothetical protein